MLSIGEFSNICRVSTKTLRYYAEIGLLLPSEVNPENGYRYYAIEQLETMLFINRLKAYHFSLDEIGDILKSDSLEEQLYTALSKKKQELEWQVQNTHNTLLQINTDMKALMQGKSIMSFMEDMDVTLVTNYYISSVFMRFHPLCFCLASPFFPFHAVLCCSCFTSLLL